MKMMLNSLSVVLNILLMLLLTAAYSESMPTIKQQRTGIAHKKGTDLESSLNFTTTSEGGQLQPELAGVSVHSYLKELYTNLTYSSRLLLNNVEMEVSTVQSYKNQAKDAACGYYRFDVHEDTTDGDQILQVELCLLQTNPPTSDGHYDVDIYYLLSKSHWSPLPISFKHIDSTPGWKTFDITTIWKRGLVKYGLQLRLTKGKETLSCEGVFSKGQEDPLSTQPLLIVYANDYNTPTTSLKRDITSQQQKRTNNAIDVQNVSCHRKEMIITPDLLKHNSTRQIVGPQKFDVGVCEGQCPNSLQANADNRDLFQNFEYTYILELYYHNTKGSSIPMCCVPTSFKKKFLVFENEISGLSELIHLPIVVEKCACIS